MANKFGLICLLITLSTMQVEGQYRHGYLFLGKVQMQQEEYTKAIQYFNSAINALPNYFEGYYLRGMAKYSLNDMIGAENDMDKAIALLPAFPRLYLVRGVVRSELMKFEPAEKDFNQAIKLDSNFVQAYFYRSLNHAQQYDYEKALADCRKVIDMDPEYQGVFTLNGLINLYMDDFDRAVANFTLSIQKDSSNLRNFVERGRAHTELRNREEAMTDFNYVLNKDTANAYALFNRAQAHMDFYQYKEALNDLNRVIELVPDNELAYFNRALIKRSKNQQSDALNDFYQVLQQNPDNVLVYYNMGKTLHQLGRYDKAIQSYNKAIELLPEYADVYLERSRAFKEKGNLQQAKKDYDTWLHLNETNQHKADSLKQAQGMEIMRLTRLSSDFTTNEERKDKIQYKDTEITMAPIFQLFTDDRINAASNTYYLATNSQFVTLPAHLPNKTTAHQSDSLLQQLNKALSDNSNKERYLHAGLIHIRLNQFNEAMAYLDTAIVSNPKNHLAYFARGVAGIGELGNLLNKEPEYLHNQTTANAHIIKLYSGIIYDLERTLKLDPHMIYARYNLGYAHYLMNDMEKAHQTFRETATNHKLSEAWFNHAVISMHLEKMDEACKSLSMAGQYGYERAYALMRKYCQ